MGVWDTPGASDEWYTPPHVFDALGCRFNMDVAHPPMPYPLTPATVWYADTSLERPWCGFIWMNPPFGGRNGLVPWLDRFFAHGDGIALTPDRTSAPWFRSAWAKADLAMFTPKLKFRRGSGSIGNSPSNGTCLWAIGEAGVDALHTAAIRGLGILASPERLAA